MRKEESGLENNLRFASIMTALLPGIGLAGLIPRAYFSAKELQKYGDVESLIDDDTPYESFVEMGLIYTWRTLVQAAYLSLSLCVPNWVSPGTFTNDLDKNNRPDAINILYDAGGERIGHEKILKVWDVPQEDSEFVQIDESIKQDIADKIVAYEKIYYDPEDILTAKQHKHLDQAKNPKTRADIYVREHLKQDLGECFSCVNANVDLDNIEDYKMVTVKGQRTLVTGGHNDRYVEDRKNITLSDLFDFDRTDIVVDDVITEKCGWTSVKNEYKGDPDGIPAAAQEAILNALNPD
jgi:hypothetical protein